MTPQVSDEEPQTLCDALSPPHVTDATPPPSSVLPHDDIMCGILRHLTSMRDAKAAALSCRDAARIIRVDLLPGFYVRFYSRRALCRAAEDGQTYVLNRLLQRQLNEDTVYWSTRRRKKAIAGAARHGRLNCVLLLLQYEGKRGGCFRAAAEACKRGQDHVVKEMLTRGRWSWCPEVRAVRLLHLLEVTSLEESYLPISETLLLHVVENFQDTEQWYNACKLMGMRVYRACADQRRDECISSLMACERAGLLPLDEYYALATIGAACRWGWTEVGQTVLRLSDGKVRLTIEMARLACENRHLDTARWITGVCGSSNAGIYSNQLLSSARRQARLAGYDDVHQALLRMDP